MALFAYSGGKWVVMQSDSGKLLLAQSINGYSPIYTLSQHSPRFTLLLSTDRTPFPPPTLTVTKKVALVITIYTALNFQTGFKDSHQFIYANRIILCCWIFS